MEKTDLNRNQAESVVPVRNFAKDYYVKLKGLLDSIEVTNSDGEFVELCEAIEQVTSLILRLADRKHKAIFIGNGASAAISSHIATDLWKNAGVKAMAFNDSSLLTCISNDLGYDHVFEKPIEMFADPEDVLMAISSSGQSENILRAASAAKNKGLKLVTFSGFAEQNPLRKLGDVNFYVPAANYGFVEIVHLSICHCLVDTVIGNKSK